ncbi:DUF1294 domain-containing protein [Flavobacterium algicola]|uniref:DUF1294 domain-containing protein n=1 Tax=Flavobacterium algicola TaxID=556529 RepID=UPI001EFC469A|nr:DUF1294 domain-containing protein [Flavobacterium algicola]MCG9791942.1 DUF1294 domain-containing protein [Flavobacterium algicola]
MSILFCYFLIVNFLGFTSTGYDKFLARRRKRRIPEKTLLSIAAFGGSIGSGIGMLIFRHKTSKRSYLLKFWGIIILHIVVLYLLFTNEIISLKL